MNKISKKKFVPSLCKLDGEGYWNNYDSKYAGMLQRDRRIDFVDLVSETCWFNCEDTAVFEITFKDTAEAITFCQAWKRADEIHSLQVGPKTFIFRLWWD